MAYATANGKDVLQARIGLPRVGVWHADVAVDDAAGLSGAVTLKVGSFQLQGTVRRGGVLADTGMARIVGGAAGLPSALPSKQYRFQPVNSVLVDILGAAGESLASSADPSVLQTTLPMWMVQAGTCGRALAALLEEVPDAVWRVLPDGSVWVGYETWPPSALMTYELVDGNDPVRGTDTLFADTPSVVPGTVFNGGRVSYVAHSFTETELRTEVWYQ